MSRSGYSDDGDDQWAFIRYRGAVASAMRGKYGQAFLNEMLAAMDALPEKRLIAEDLMEVEGAVCAIGAVGKARGIDMTQLDPENIERVADTFGIADCLAREIVYTNDECFDRETPAERFVAMRAWIKNQIWHARGCVDNPSGETPRYPKDLGLWNPRYHYKAVVALNEI